MSSHDLTFYQARAGAVGRAAEVHGEGEDEVPHLAVLPQEDHALRGQQVRTASAVDEDGESFKTLF